jgi:hypothetical protein
MDKEELYNLAQNPNLISGIYNYCDRWCERCAFTSKCLNYAYGEEQFPNPESRDIKNQAFWDKMHESFQLTMEMIRDFAQKEGIDLDDVDTEEISKQEEHHQEAAENYECSQAAKKYGHMVDDWFDNAKDLIREKEREVLLRGGLTSQRTDLNQETAAIKDAIEIIRWYQHQIYVKLMRGLQGELTERGEILDEFPKDSDGSVKVALIAMDRSLTAWGKMYKYFPEKNDMILDMLVLLERLRRKAETEFPNARAFVRPGFDTV